MNFYLINIIHNSEKITITPIKFFRISDSYNRIVVTYKIVYRLNFFVHETHINYYLSDGNTNHLRANMLYPFMCFSKNGSDSCIITRGIHDGLLFKISGVKNISLTKINDDILTKTKRQICQKKKISFKDADSMILKYLDDTRIEYWLDEKSTDETKFNYKMDAHVGLLSIVSRIENLLDLIISLYTEPLIDIKSIDHYKPIPIRSALDKGIDFYDFKILFKDLDLEDKICPENSDNSFVDRILRENLIKELNYIIELLINTKLFDVKSVKLEPEIITQAIFNDRNSKICKDNGINPSRIINYKKYFIISEKLLEIMSKKINVITNNYNSEICKIEYNKDKSLKKNIAKKLYLKKTYDLNNLKSMLLGETLFMSQKLERKDDILPINIEVWDGTCYRLPGS
jgi:hypothetical protein